MALWLVLASLAIRALVPAGFMVGARLMVLTVEVCADTTGVHLTRQISVPASDGPDRSRAGEHHPACPFSSLSMFGLATEVPPLLAVALALALALGFAAMPLRPLPQPPYLRPPLRGPPNRSCLR